MENASQDRAHATVEIGRQLVEVPTLAPGEHRAYSFDIHEDADYDITIVFASGKTLHASAGYVTSGMHSQDTIKFTDTAIVLTTGIAQ